MRQRNYEQVEKVDNEIATCTLLLCMMLACRLTLSTIIVKSKLMFGDTGGIRVTITQSPDPTLNIAC